MKTSLFREIDDELEFARYTEKLERQWHKSRPRINEIELLRELPDAKQMLQEKIDEQQAQRGKLVSTISSKLTVIRDEIDSDNHLAKDFFRAWLKANEGEQLIATNRHIARLKGLQTALSGKQTRYGDFETAKQQALATPIDTIAEHYTRLRKLGNKLTGKCPLHEDRSPSFYLYSDTNTFHCFGCQANGDVITLVQRLQDCSFTEALNFLAHTNL